ncbi:MAG TPA: MerR family transcriptional regulator [Acidimicrobiales bacterium]|nr:MerR family transcriptional regulator [Acidimicrobiales bacterium]
MEELVTSPELCQLAGISYRQLDYWTRQGVLSASRPARGSGSFRGWTVDEAALARVCGQLSRLGATATVLRAIVAAIQAFPELWSGRVVIQPDGTVIPVGVATNRDGWIIDLAAAREWVGAEPVVWPGATAAVG